MIVLITALATTLAAALIVVTHRRPDHQTPTPARGADGSATAHGNSSSDSDKSSAGAVRLSSGDSPGTLRVNSGPGVMDLRTLKDRPLEADKLKSEDLLAVRQTVAALSAEAVAIAQKVADEYPHTSDPYGLLGMAYNQLEETSQALQCWEEVIRINPNRSDAYEVLGVLLMRRGEFEQAVNICRRGLARAGETATLQTRLGAALIAAGHPDEALEPLREAVKTRKTDLETWNLLGKAELLCEHYGEAKTAFEKAVAIAPDDETALFGFATTCDRLGLEDQVQPLLEKQRTIASDRIERANTRRTVSSDVERYQKIVALICFHAAKIYAGHRDIDKAEQVARRGIEVQPKDLDCRAMLAVLLRKTGRAEQSIEICKEMIELAPDRAEPHYYLSLSYGELHRDSEALEEAHKGLALAPNDERLRERVASLEGGK